MNPTPCKSCHALMIFAVNVKTGRTVPLNAIPEKRWILDGNQARLVDAYTGHHWTCPFADQHRNRSA